MRRELTARRVIVDSDAQTLTIDWKDGHQTVFPLDGLRRACPCASCSGGHAQMGRLPDPEVFQAPATRRWTNVRLELVGSYAVRITWDDGHRAGMYTWERLRATCPCMECQGLRAEGR